MSSARDLRKFCVFLRQDVSKNVPNFTCRAVKKALPGSTEHDRICPPDRVLDISAAIFGAVIKPDEVFRPVFRTLQPARNIITPQGFGKTNAVDIAFFSKLLQTQAGLYRCSVPTKHHPLSACPTSTTHPAQPFLHRWAVQAAFLSSYGASWRTQKQWID